MRYLQHGLGAVLAFFERWSRVSLGVGFSLRMLLGALAWAVLCIWLRPEVGYVGNISMHYVIMVASSWASGLSRGHYAHVLCFGAWHA